MTQINDMNEYEFTASEIPDIWEILQVKYHNINNFDIKLQFSYVGAHEFYL